MGEIGDSGRDHGLDARGKLAGFLHKFGQILEGYSGRPPGFEIRAENGRSHKGYAVTSAYLNSLSLFLMLCRIFGGVHTEKTLTYRGEAAALIVLAIPCSLYPLMKESTYPSRVLLKENQ